jgi:GrpB-like predicted nucleotidyltransferase (UPF0157 family)
MVLSKYNPEWPKQFESIKSILQKQLAGIVFRIEHVGSTSIKDLSAKPKIDIDIVVPKDVSLEVIKEKLGEIGYSIVEIWELKVGKFLTERMRKNFTIQL